MLASQRGPLNNMAVAAAQHGHRSPRVLEDADVVAESREGAHRADDWNLCRQTPLTSGPAEGTAGPYLGGMISGERRRHRILPAAAVALVIGISGCTPPVPVPPAASPPEESRSASATATARPSTPTTPSAPSTPRPTTVTQQNPRWALDRIDQHRRPLDKRFTTTSQGKGVTVYVVDGLFDVTNAEFGGRASEGLDNGEACGLEDGTNHGLFVAGLVAGRRTGVAKQAKIVSVGSSYGCEGGNDATEAQARARIVRAIRWVAKNARKPAVVNLSLNLDAPAPEIAAGVKRLVRAGLTVVASAGNDGVDACRHPPAGLPSVITATASTESDKDAGLNNGRCVDLFAPGEGVTSVADPELSPNRLVTSEYAATSWAAPLVSGTAALYLSAHPTASPDEVRDWLVDNATKGVMRGNLHGSPNRLLFTGGPL